MEKRALVTIIGLAAFVCSACGASPTEPTANIALRGIVTGYQGAALEGATLEVLDGANRGTSVVTDAQGRYGFSDLEPGGFTIRASVVDYATATKSVTLTADTSVDFQLKVLLAQIAIDEHTLTFVGNPDGTFSAQGQALNTGDGCAADLTGTANLADNDRILVATLLWSMPPNQILRPGDRYTYQFCCLTRDQATAVATFNASFRWVTVHCP